MAKILQVLKIISHFALCSADRLLADNSCRESRLITLNNAVILEIAETGPLTLAQCLSVSAYLSCQFTEGSKGSE